MNVPETLRSAGVPARPIPPPPVRRAAWATYEVGHGEAVVQVTYLGNDELWSAFRVRLKNPRVDANGVDPLYEAAYSGAARAARVHGYDLERFSRFEPPRRARPTKGQPS